VADPERLEVERVRMPDPTTDADDEEWLVGDFDGKEDNQFVFSALCTCDIV